MLEVHLTCGDTITVQSTPKVGSYRFCIHCDKREKVVQIVAPQTCEKCGCNCECHATV